MRSFNYPVTTVFWGCLIIAGLILSIQLPFAYYSADNVFHTAKIMAAADGEITTDPITGFKGVYPPLFHTLFGFIAWLFGLSGFQVMRLVQVANFAGLHLAAWYLYRTIIGDREQSALAALCTTLLIYGPTGKYIFFQNPFNTSIIFCLLGTAWLIRYHQSSKFRYGVFGVIAFGIGVNIWWWNIFPLAGVMLGIAYLAWRKSGPGTAMVRILGLLLPLAVVLSYNLFVFLQIKDVLPNYDYDMTAYSYFGKHSFGQTILAWIGGFLLKGNQPFLKHLFPAAMSAESKVVLLYAFFASVHYYLIILPFNFAMLYFSSKKALAEIRARSNNAAIILFIAAVVTFLLSIIALFRTDPSVLRRIQFHCFLFMMPGFMIFVFSRLGDSRGRIFKYGLTIIGAGVMLFTVVYRFSPDFDNPLPRETKEVVAWIESLPDHADTRIFTTGLDALILCREVRFRTFILDQYNPVYFRLDKTQADSIYNAYQSIVNTDNRAEFWLKTFDTRYAIIGKKAVNISPVMTKITENEKAGHMLSFFGDRGEMIFENSHWAVFDLRNMDR